MAEKRDVLDKHSAPRQWNVATGDMIRRFIVLSKTFHFEAAHHLPHYDGPCARLHGHNYVVRLTISTSLEYAEASGVVVDFAVMKSCIEQTVIAPYDHRNLNDFFIRPTAEIMVEVMANDIIGWFKQWSILQKVPVTVEAVRLYETPTCYAEWRYRV